ncbi:hypothetical protein TIFTF001_007568 [Ficus carica]|uniref:Uncharacterized protein n=1 Tax=Ficus carica TaxID=3494 RepID=A0AA88DGJ2_FICCA|nr:hypothetical protein TIFTF001_007568 [Ficus carica]
MVGEPNVASLTIFIECARGARDMLDSAIVGGVDEDMDLANVAISEANHGKRCGGGGVTVGDTRPTQGFATM